jgi:hypothetical protein
MLRQELNQCLVFFLAHYLNTFRFTVTLCIPLRQGAEIEMDDFNNQKQQQQQQKDIPIKKRSQCGNDSTSCRQNIPTQLNYIICKESMYILEFHGQKFSQLNCYFDSIKTFEERYKGSGYHLSKVHAGRYRLLLSIERDSEFYKFCHKFHDQLFDCALAEGQDIVLGINLKNYSEVSKEQGLEVDYTWIHSSVF